jgi:hypothetical protein
MGRRKRKKKKKKRVRGTSRGFHGGGQPAATQKQMMVRGERKQTRPLVSIQAC